MRNLLTACISLFVFAASVVAQENDGFTIEAMPPSVVKTVPQAGQTDVHPSLDQIRVTFSKDMLTDRMWSVVQVSKEHFPKVRKDAKGVHYLDDKRTCVIPVDLEAGQTYVVWFNQGRYNSFRDTLNHPAVPYLLVFRTAKAK